MNKNIKSQNVKIEDCQFSIVDKIATYKFQVL